jgi:hypothetical protein
MVPGKSALGPIVTCFPIFQLENPPKTISSTCQIWETGPMWQFQSEWSQRLGLWAVLSLSLAPFCRLPHLEQPPVWEPLQHNAKVMMS